MALFGLLGEASTVDRVVARLLGAEINAVLDGPPADVESGAPDA